MRLSSRISGSLVAGGGLISHLSKVRFLGDVPTGAYVNWETTCFTRRRIGVRIPECPPLRRGSAERLVPPSNITRKDRIFQHRRMRTSVQ